jgi:hypothetical protein
LFLKHTFLIKNSAARVSCLDAMAALSLLQSAFSPDLRSHRAFSHLPSYGYLKFFFPFPAFSSTIIRFDGTAYKLLSEVG